MRALLASLVFGVFLAGGSGVVLADGAGKAKPHKAKAQKEKGEKGKAAPDCETDSDCVLMPEGCCGCNEGGKQKAVPAKGSEKLETKRKSGCKQTMCSQMISQDPSCSSRAVCKENRCVLGQ
jgi:hypothetical protein